MRFERKCQFKCHFKPLFDPAVLNLIAHTVRIGEDRWNWARLGFDVAEADIDSLSRRWQRTDNHVTYTDLVTGGIDRKTRTKHHPLAAPFLPDSHGQT